MILAANDTISIVFNFIAVAIIAEFDNFVYLSMKKETFKKIITDNFAEQAFPIQRTTSKKCKDYEMTKEKDEDGNLIPLRISFESRSKCNKLKFIIYKICRSFYVSVFFYFAPFSVIILSTILPNLHRADIEL